MMDANKNAIRLYEIPFNIPIMAGTPRLNYVYRNAAIKMMRAGSKMYAKLRTFSN